MLQLLGNFIVTEKIIDASKMLFLIFALFSIAPQSDGKRCRSSPLCFIICIIFLLLPSHTAFYIAIAFFKQQELSLFYALKNDSVK